MRAALTPWFSIEKDGNPIRAGWYDIVYKGDPMDEDFDGDQRYWDGVNWCVDDFPGNSSLFGNAKYGVEGEHWRGLLEPAAS